MKTTMATFARRLAAAISLFSMVAGPGWAKNCECDLSGIAPVSEKRIQESQSKTIRDRLWQPPWHAREFPRPPSITPPDGIPERDQGGVVGQLPGVLRSPPIERRLAGCAPLRDAIVWQSATGEEIPFVEWSNEQKARLDGFFQALVQEEELDMQCPDPNRAVQGLNGYLTAEEAFDVYAAHVAHAVYLESTNRMPWSVACRPADELAHFLASRNYHAPILPSSTVLPGDIQAQRDFQIPYYSVGMPSLSCDPRIGYRFMTGQDPHQDQDLVGTDEEDTLARLSLFFNAHWLHGESLGNFGDELEVKRRNALLSDRLAPSGRHSRTAYAGCHGAASTFYELARSVNIPLVNVRTQQNPSDGIHYGGGSFSNRTHGGLIYAAGSPDPRILWHLDDIYANYPGPNLPIDARRGVTLSEAGAKQRYFEQKWPRASELSAWGYVYDLELVIPGEGLAQNIRPQYNTRMDYGYSGGYWLLSDRAEALYAAPPQTGEQWLEAGAASADLSKRHDMEVWHQLGNYRLLREFCERNRGQYEVIVNDMISGSRQGLTVPVSRSLDEYWRHSQRTVEAYGGCEAVTAAYEAWQEGQQ